jgi:hypothetical protein
LYAQLKANIDDDLTFLHYLTHDVITATETAPSTEEKTMGVKIRRSSKIYALIAILGVLLVGPYYSTDHHIAAPTKPAVTVVAGGPGACCVGDAATHN